MDQRRLSAIAHGGMTFWNPLGNAAADRIVGFAAHTTGARILDVGCGAGELLLRTVAKCGGQGIGVDPWPFAIEKARRAASRKFGEQVRFLEEPFDVARFEPASFDVFLCVGSTHACGGFPGTLDAAAKLLRPGGRAVLGESFWLKPPADEYLEVLGTTRDALGDLPSLREWAEAGGFSVRGAYDVPRSERDTYENTYCENVRRHIADRPGTPDGAAMLAHTERWHAAYLAHGRATLGFVVLNLVREGGSE